MDISADLPAGLTARPLTMADARGVYQVMADLERAEIGSADIEEADIIGDWQQPSVDVPATTMGVFDEDRLVGYAEAAKDGHCDAGVHPDWHGRGIGTALARWMQHRSLELGATVVGMPVPEGKSGDRLLASLGYRVRWTSWVLQLPEGRTIIPERPLPDGYVVREALAEEYRTVHQVIDDAFSEWSERAPKPFEDFEASVIGRPGSSRRCLLARPGARSAGVRSGDRLPHRRPLALREGRHGGGADLGQPWDRPHVSPT